MPLSSNAVTLHGGCNCRAIRYRIEVPPLSSRPINPFSDDSQVTFPMIATDHCNDCRRATGSILPTWICVPAEMISVSLRRAPPSAAPKVESNDGPWRPAMEVLRAGSRAAEGSTLSFYGSSPQRTRTFCGHCGTNLTYAIFPMVQGLPDLFDTVLGTLDRGDLESASPERHCWWERGIPWVQAMTSGGPEIPRHPTFKVNEFVD